MYQKNIAVLMTALDSDAQVDTLRGIEEYGKAYGYNIAVFLWFTGAFEKEKHNWGEINITNLPDLQLFDGVILFANTLNVDSNRKKMEELLEPLTCPIVSIGCKLGNSYSISTDNYAAMKELVEHYVVDHKMKRIHFVKGIEGNSDAEARFKAYVDVLNEHGIPILAEYISQGDFYVTGGELAAREILNSNTTFPEAIVCANDMMAITICDILMENGYRIPEDVVISGYDDRMEAQNHYPRITSVKRRCYELGKEACKCVLDRLDGKEVNVESFIPDEVVLAESCGCHNPDSEERQPRALGGLDVAQRKIIHQMILLKKNIMAGEDFGDWINSLKEFIRQINPPEFYCCVNEDFIEDVFEMDAIEQEDLSSEERLAYSSNVKVILAYQNGMFKNKASFESKYALDDLFMGTEKKKTYIFSPIHYLDRNFGYFIFADSTFPLANPLYISWLIDMGHAIENIRKQSLLKTAMNRLDEMYIKDSLTGVYNRFGMDRFFAELKKKCMMSRFLMQLSFIDVDGLKNINDKYGHEEGDRIIKATASILQKKAKKFYVIRYGGDEFIVMGAVRDEKEVEDYWKAVQEEIDTYNQTMRKSAMLSISHGYDIFNVAAETYLEDCIRVTDKKMYINKKEKKNLNAIL